MGDIPPLMKLTLHAFVQLRDDVDQEGVQLRVLEIVQGARHENGTDEAQHDFEAHDQLVLAAFEQQMLETLKHSRRSPENAPPRPHPPLYPYPSRFNVQQQ